MILVAPYNTHSPWMGVTNTHQICVTTTWFHHFGATDYSHIRRSRNMFGFEGMDLVQRYMQGHTYHVSH